MEIMIFEKVQLVQVVVNNVKFYVNLEEGFVGMGFKKDIFIIDCLDIDDVIVFCKDGKFMVMCIVDKIFVGKNIIYVDVWKKGDDCIIYNMVYVDVKMGWVMIKCFNVMVIICDKEYDLIMGYKLNKVFYFSVNFNGEVEIINVQLILNVKV